MAPVFVHVRTDSFATLIVPRLLPPSPANVVPLVAAELQRGVKVSFQLPIALTWNLCIAPLSIAVDPLCACEFTGTASAEKIWKIAPSFVQVSVESRANVSVPRLLPPLPEKCLTGPDRKSTRLNSSHMSISYAVFCLKKKN